MRCAGYQGAASILTRALTHFAETSGMRADVVPDVTATGETARALFDGLEAGTRDTGYMASGYLTERVPALGILDLPFAVTDRARAHAAWDGAVGQALALAVREETGLQVLGIWDNGFRHVSTARTDLRAPADCAGLRIRTLDNAIYRDTLAALGFTPVITDVAELVASVREGRVDAQENPLTNLLTFGLDAWHRHVALTGHIHGAVLHVANGRWWDALATDDRARLADAAAAATALQRRLADEADRHALRLLRERGVQVRESREVDLAAFRSATAPVFDAVLRTVPKDLADRYLAEINYYR